MRSIARKGAPLLALALLAGCINFAPRPPDKLITLTPEATAPAGVLGAVRADQALVVVDPETDRSLDVLRVPVQITPASVAYLKEAAWVEKPARQFRNLLAETIRAKRGRLVHEGFGGFGGDRQLLSGRLVALGYDAQSQAVVVRFDAVLSARDTPLRSQRFEARVDNVAPDVGAVAPAINRAANEVAAQVASWVG